MSESTGKVENLVIAGTGPAGLTAAIYAARANLNPLCLEGIQPGGQLTITSDVENYPGFAEPVVGPELMDAFHKQAERFGTRFEQSQIESMKILKNGVELQLSGNKTLTTRALIIATGASAKWLGIESEKKFMGKGLSACATCDGFFFKKKDLVVVGGGDTAMEEATFLTRFASKVTVVHRRDTLRASKAMQDRAQKNPKIEFIWNSAIEEILGDQAVEGVRIKNLKTNETSELKVQGVFVAIGHKPNTDPFKEHLKCDEAGYIVPAQPGTSKTSVPGVFVAGDVSDHVYRQAVTAAGAGCMAAMDAERYLEEDA